jgi:hypothetical protein
MPEIQAAIRAGFVVIERTKRTGGVSSRRLDFHNIGSGSGKQFTAELAFLIGEFKDFHVEKKSCHNSPG